MKGENQPKTGRGDNRGMAVVVLDALTSISGANGSEEDLAKAMKLHSKQLRHTLRFFEEEKLVTRDHIKEIEVALADVKAKEESTTSDTNTTSLKVLPPWMIKQGMHLMKEQRGEVKPDQKGDEISQPVDEKKPKVEAEDEKSIQDEYLKAYYAALVKRQEEQAAASDRMQQADKNSASTSYLPNGVSETTSERQVGIKTKREDHDNDDIYWEEAPPAFVRQVGMKVKREDDDDDGIDWEDVPPAGKAFKVADLNVQADEVASCDDSEDEIDWAEG